VCINDFNADKFSVDAGMRSAYICPSCLTDVPHEAPLIGDLRLLLDAVSMSSRLNVNIVDHLPKMLETRRTPWVRPKR